MRTDPDTNEVLATITVNFLSSMVAADDRIYAYSHSVNRVTILDPATEAVIGTAQPTAPPAGFGADGLWGADAENLLHLDESTLEAAESFRISMTETEVSDMEFAGPSIWLLLPDQTTLMEVRP